MKKDATNIENMSHIQNKHYWSNQILLQYKNQVYFSNLMNSNHKFLSVQQKKDMKMYLYM